MKEWTDDRLQFLADGWFLEIRSGSKIEGIEDSFASEVTEFSFFAPVDAKWRFLIITSDMAKDQNEAEFAILKS